MSGSQPMRRGNKKNANQSGSSMDEVDELTKDEKQIARYLRLSCAKKQGNLMGMKVDFFVGQKLVDALLDSKWGPMGGKNASPLLADRKAAVALMQRFMNKQLFYRAVKIYKEQTTDGDKEKSGETDGSPSKKKKKQQQESSTPSTTPKPTTTGTPAADKQSKSSETKRKFKLEMHDDQKFVDSSDPYVWVYDPTSTKTYIIGSLLIFGAIGICLFPLWPSQVREGVYYVSLAGASFLGAILGLAVLKYIIFAAVWAITFGRVHFWLLPNLTEDVGFLESFVPVYKCSMSNKPQDAKKNDDITATTEPTTAETSKQKSSDVPLTGSTVVISNTDLMDKSTTVRRRKSSASNIHEEDGFELVDDDDGEPNK